MKKILLCFVVLSLFLSVNSVFANNEGGGKTMEDRSAEAQATQDEHDAKCAASGQCLEKSSWNLNVNTFVPGPVFEKSGMKERADSLFEKVIKSLMVILGVLSVFIMTIGGGYMILHNGQDELLNKGKSIFTAGIISMVIALCSYFLIDIVINILYK